MQGFDFELSFLDSYVENQKATGKKEYDKKKRQAYNEFNGVDLVPKAGGGLNYKPYETPGMSRINTELP